MKVGIIGFAHMHSYSYARAVRQMEYTELAAVTDDDQSRGKQAAEHFGAKYYSEYEMLLQQDLDAVIITSENNKHHEYVLAAARAGKHILCEKPIAINVKDAEEMIEVCREFGVILQIAFPVRYNTTVVRAKQLIDEGKLGRIMAMKGTNRGKIPGGWFVDRNLSGGGAVLDHTVHVVDIMRWLSGAEVREVYAEVDNLLSPHPIDDCGILTMEFGNGVLATLDCSWSRNKDYPWGDVTLEIVGTEGTLKIDSFFQNLDKFTNGNGRQSVFWGDDMDAELIRDIIGAIKERRDPGITGEDGLQAIEVAFAAYRATESNEPVRIRR